MHCQYIFGSPDRRCSLLLICVNIAAGLYALLVGNVVSLFCFLLTSLKPSLNIFNIGIFSSTGDQQGLSYTLGGFAIGSCLVLYSNWFRRLEAAFPSSASITNRKLGLAIGNFIFILLFLPAYAWLFYYESQRYPGKDYPGPFVAMLCIPAIVTILVRYNRRSNELAIKNLPEKELDWKDVGLLYGPVIAFCFSVFSIYKFLYDGYFKGQNFNAPAGTWIEGAGLGLLIGIIVGSYFIFIHLLIEKILRDLVRKKFKEDLVVLLSTTITWVSCIFLGEFSHLNHINKPYTVVGLIAGILFSYLLSLTGYKLGVRENKEQSLKR